MIEWARPDGSPKVTYVIATNPRTGSWLLADALNRTGVAGKPGEWFSRLEHKKIIKCFPGMNYEDYCRFVCAESSTPNGVSAIKMHRRDFDELSKHASAATVIGDAKWVYLYRLNKARQAISYVIAKQTDEWWRFRGERVDNHLLTYDAAAIAKAERELTDLDSAWESWFEAEGIAPLRLTYEGDLDCGRYRETAHHVMRWIGVDDPPSPGTSRLVKQADKTTEDWLLRYRGE